MEEPWEQAIQAALKGQQSDTSPPRALTLDGAVKPLNGHLPSPSLFETMMLRSLEHLSIANVRLASLEGFPRLANLRRLILSDNRIAGGLQSLVDAGLAALRDLDLSNNRISTLEDIGPLSKLQLMSLDLYECPVTKIKDYRSKVFEMIGSLKYLDKIDIEGNERPETDDEEEDEEGEEDEEKGEDDDESREEGEDDEGEEDDEEGEEDDEEEECDEERDEQNGDANGEEDPGKEYIVKPDSEHKSENGGSGHNGVLQHQSSSSGTSKRKRDGDDL